MRNKLKNNLLYIGILIFSLTSLAEQLFPIEANLICFLKGFGCALGLVGAVVMIKKKAKRQSSR
ncbi:hypothetical protein M2132_000807 [Dysgonomonas sp. PH5-45]|uniref:hypothetical protein n=1 Tax=Dysgonomonas sp. PH5-45 TaxID=1742396 RepID=UPI0024755967|nr:hypothetical protein [Dysgonomonas sp. PH5-45]MDH6354479.1 hypothetical protein [Dysgonomonas sp. PH5-45]MDH6387464.1 hypothetical protein [Dysgonomonas sp. PH5-37]